MNLTLLLPWLPIILAVGIGGRLLGRPRAVALAGLCAVFWMVLVWSMTGFHPWDNPLHVATVIAGAAAIIAMGAWSGEMAFASPRQRETAAASSSNEVPVADTTGSGAPLHRLKTGATQVHPDPGGSTVENPLTTLTTAMDYFDDWLEEHRDDVDPWPKFDELVRSVMYRCCQATHVKPFRLLSEGDELLPLREIDSLADVPRVSPRRGIVGHVVTTGRSYVAGDEAQGDLVRKLADEGDETIAWCFAVTQGNRKIGVVTVGQLNICPQGNGPLLRAVEKLVRQYWATLCEVCRSRSAVLDDPVSKLLTREAFVRIADKTLQDSYRLGEPVAVAAIALEGLRQLNDSGRWERADELVREASGLLRYKVRTDDQLGRFDGSRFLVLLRRVDSELATLILDQLMTRLGALCENTGRWRTRIRARCGIVGSGTGQPDLRTLIARAVEQCHRARAEGESIASDLGVESTVAGEKG